MHTKSPIYRKYSNDKNYFKIISDSEFEELQFMGSRVFVYTKKAEIYPDKLLIQDLINYANEFITELSESDYLSRLAEV